MAQSLRIPGRSPLAFPRLYLWYLTFATLDIVVTTVILSLGGRELNGLAALALARLGLPGLALVKFLAVAIVVVIVETIFHSSDAPKQRATAMRIAEWAIAASVIPVVVGLIQLAVAC